MALALYSISISKSTLQLRKRDLKQINFGSSQITHLNAKPNVQKRWFRNVPDKNKKEKIGNMHKEQKATKNFKLSQIQKVNKLCSAVLSEII